MTFYLYIELTNWWWQFIFNELDYDSFCWAELLSLEKVLFVSEN